MGRVQRGEVLPWIGLCQKGAIVWLAIFKNPIQKAEEQSKAQAVLVKQQKPLLLGLESVWSLLWLRQRSHVVCVQKLLQWHGLVLIHVSHSGALSDDVL